MTRKDYEILARAFYHSRGYLINTIDGHNMWNSCVANIADALAGTNPRFDHSKFTRACNEFKLAHEKARLL